MKTSKQPLASRLAFLFDRIKDSKYTPMVALLVLSFVLLVMVIIYTRG